MPLATASSSAKVLLTSTQVSPDSLRSSVAFRVFARWRSTASTVVAFASTVKFDGVEY